MSKIGHRKILERSGEWGSGWKDDISFTLDSGCGRDLIIMEEQKPIKYIDLFAGVGGFRHGIKNSGKHAVCVYSNEWDKYANSVYKKHYGECDNRDIRDVKAEEIPDFDLLVGGFPCQSFSIAGRRGGFADTRGTLFFEIARIAKQKQPRFLLLENVKGILSHDKGRTFNTIISTLDELGYDAEWQVLNSKDFGVPQNRERVFIIGYLRGTSRRQVFPFFRGNEKNLKQVISGGQGNRVYDPSGTSTTIASQAGGQGAKTGLYTVPVLTPDRAKKRQNGRRMKTDGEPSFTLTKQDKHGIYNGTKIRRLTPVECNRLQSFPDNWDKYGIENATPEMYNRGYANAKKADTIKILQELWETVNKDTRERRGFTESFTLLTEKILQQDLYARGLQGEMEEGRCVGTTGELQSETVNNCDRMYEVWIKEKLRYSPQRQKQIEQQFRKLRSTVQKLPHKITSQRGQVEQRESQKQKKEQQGQICFKWISDSGRYKMMGNGVTTNVVTAIIERLLA